MEPEVDGCGGHGAVKDMDSLLEACRRDPGKSSPVDQPLDFVPTGIVRWIETGGSATVAVAALTVGPLVVALGNGALDLPMPQLTAVAAR